MEPRIARRAVVSALIAGAIADAVFDGSALGVNVPLATAAALLLVTWFGPRRRPADLLDAWLPGLAMAASLGPSHLHRPDGRCPRPAPRSRRRVGVGLRREWGRGHTPVDRGGRHAGRPGRQVRSGWGSCWLLARSGSDGAFSRTARNVGRLAPIARGAIVAVPVVIGFSLLLTSADAVFGRALDEALHLPFDLDVIVQRGTFATLAAFLVGGPIAIAVGASSALGTIAEAPSVAEVEPTAGPMARRSGVTEVLVIVGAVDVLFALFAVVQIVYLFGGTDTLAAIGMSYSDYARQGYFQLVGVVALAGLLLLGAHAIVGRTRAFLVAAVALLVLTAVILASAALRLALYQGAYGWTELRFFVAASIVWLATCVVLALALLSANRMRWLPHGLAMSAAAVTLAISAIGPQAFVMHQNLARVLDPSLVASGGHSGLDIGYGVSLGDDAIPDLVTALDVVPAVDRPNLLRTLRLRRDELAGDVASTGPLSWNLARTRARDALARLPSE